MAAEVLSAPVLADGCRHIVLYAHGGLNAEITAAKNAARLWRLADDQQLRAYFFVWESGIGHEIETILADIAAANG
jgi:hypothetical protein